MNRLKTLSIALLFFSFSAWASETTVHRSETENLQSNGWHLATSTEGDFSILVPWPFDDATINTKSPIYTITSASEHTTMYTAALIPTGTQPKMYRIFNDDLKNPNMKIGKHQGNISIYEIKTVNEQGLELKIHTKRIKSEYGLYYLMTLTEIQNEKPSDIKQFFSSLVIPGNQS